MEHRERFRIDVPEQTVQRIRRRLTDARWPEAPADDGDWRYGAVNGYSIVNMLCLVQ